jgi:hypothetical protein
MRHSLLVSLLVLCWSSLPTATHAAPQGPVASVPAPLRPWVPWVKAGDTSTRPCPFLHRGKSRRCAWPTRLELRLDARGGTFKQSWRLYRKELIALPGDAKRWPLDVRVGGKAAPVVESKGRPKLVLPAGVHVVEGRFSWAALPQSLAVPADTGLVGLWLAGKAMTSARRDSKGGLLLGQKKVAAGENRRLDVVVHRKLVDEVPLEVTTRIKLDIAGVGRELVLPDALLPGFTALSLQSKLPARLEADGRLRVQVRPGKWEIIVAARQSKRSNKLTLPKGSKQEGTAVPRVWGEEVWVFSPRPQLRLVEVTGVSPVDPQQTSLLASWKRFSSYRVAPGQTLTLQQRRRGAAGRALDHLALRRTLWLDFDGKGMTISDRLTGRLQRSTRLEALPSTKLGRVAVGERDQFITKRGARVGLEVARGPIKVIAESRYEADPGQVPAVGWNHDVQSLSATLHLPPGWRVFAVSGADRAPGTWIARWTLLDMFLVLVIGLAIARLFGWKVGLLALIGLVLTFTEPGAPRWIWPFVVVLEALRRVLPRGWLHKTLVVVHLAFALALVLIALPFALQQIRQAIYPTLEYPGHQAARGRVRQRSGILSLLALADHAPAQQREEVPQWLKKAAKSGEERGSMATRRSHADTKPDISKLKGGRGKKGKLYQLRRDSSWQVQKLFDPNAIVQTGPGVPVWGWNAVELRWNGPVRKAEAVGLTLLSPAVNLALGLLRAAVILALLVLLIVVARRRRSFGGDDAASDDAASNDAASDDAPSDEAPPPASKTVARTAAMILLALFSAAALTLPSQLAIAQTPFPPSTLLQELDRRLTPRAPCHPSCASSARLALEVDGKLLRMRFEVDAAALTALPLPGRVQQWRPTTVLVDGKPPAGLARHGDHLWLAVPPGRHQVQLQGPLGAAATLQLTLPLRPHRVEAKVSGWRLDGVNDDGLPDETLTLSRVRTSKSGKEAGPGGAKAALQPFELPPFVRVTRRIVLGLSWHVETTVTRLTPTGSPVVLAIPLLAGELVTSDRYRVKKGALQLQLAPQQKSASWRSTLRRRPALTLAASQDGRWSERWELLASPIWHVDAKGLPRIHQGADDKKPPMWRPWPGETLVLSISRPKGIGGRSLTIDGARLVLRPGRRATDATLIIGLRSSRGGQHLLSVPKGARVQKVKLGDKSFPVQQDGRRLTLPLSPGAMKVEVSWRQETGMGFRYSSPALSLGSEAVNVEIELRTPRSRWVLLTGGARVGPVVLFWSLLGLLEC